MSSVINRNSDNIKLTGRIGTWYVVDETIYLGRKVFLLEHEEYGDETEALAVLEDGRVVCDEIYDNWLGHLDEADLGELFAALDNSERLVALKDTHTGETGLDWGL